jgi:hypothetical protein
MFQSKAPKKEEKICLNLMNQIKQNRLAGIETRIRIKEYYTDEVKQKEKEDDEKKFIDKYQNAAEIFTDNISKIYGKNNENNGKESIILVVKKKDVMTEIITACSNNISIEEITPFILEYKYFEEDDIKSIINYTKKKSYEEKYNVELVQNILCVICEKLNYQFTDNDYNNILKRNIGYYSKFNHKIFKNFELKSEMLNELVPYIKKFGKFNIDEDCLDLNNKPETAKNIFLLYACCLYGGGEDDILEYFSKKYDVSISYDDIKFVLERTKCLKQIFEDINEIKKIVKISKGQNQNQDKKYDKILDCKTIQDYEEQNEKYEFNINNDVIIYLSKNILDPKIFCYILLSNKIILNDNDIDIIINSYNNNEQIDEIIFAIVYSNNKLTNKNYISILKTKFYYKIFYNKIVAYNFYLKDEFLDLIFENIEKARIENFYSTKYDNIALFLEQIEKTCEKDQKIAENCAIIYGWIGKYKKMDEYLDKYKIKLTKEHLLLSCRAKFDKELVSLYKKNGVKIDFDVCIEFIKSQVSKSQCDLFFALR